MAKDSRKHMGLLKTFVGFLGTLVALFAACAALAQFAITLEPGNKGGYPYLGVDVKTKFEVPDCSDQTLGSIKSSTACISPAVNLKFMICASAAFTFFFALAGSLGPLRGCLPSVAVLDALYEKGLPVFFVSIGFLVFGMAGLIGFAAGIACFVMAVLTLICCFV